MGQQLPMLIGAGGTAYGAIQDRREKRHDKHEALKAQQANAAANQQQNVIQQQHYEQEQRQATAKALLDQATADEAALANPSAGLDDAQRAEYLNRATVYRNAALRHSTGDPHALDDVYNYHGAKAMQGGANIAPVNPATVPQQESPGEFNAATPDPSGGVAAMIGAGPGMAPGNPLAHRSAAQVLALTKGQADLNAVNAGIGKTNADTTLAGTQNDTARFDLGVKQDQRPALIQKPFLDNSLTGAQTQGAIAGAGKTATETDNLRQLMPGNLLAQKFANQLSEQQLNIGNIDLGYRKQKNEADIAQAQGAGRASNASAGLIEQTTPLKKKEIIANTDEALSRSRLVKEQATTEARLRPVREASARASARYTDALSAASRLATNQSKQLFPGQQKLLNANIGKALAEMRKMQTDANVPADIKQEWSGITDRLALAGKDPFKAQEILQQMQPEVEDINKRTSIIVTAQQTGMPIEEASKLARVIKSGTADEQKLIEAYRARVGHPDHDLAITPGQFKQYERAIREGFKIWNQKTKREELEMMTAPK